MDNPIPIKTKGTIIKTVITLLIQFRGSSIPPSPYPTWGSLP
jgi:hypothetical protein